jgi:hypothetical protein
MMQSPPRWYVCPRQSSVLMTDSSCCLSLSDLCLHLAADCSGSYWRATHHLCFHLPLSHYASGRKHNQQRRERWRRAIVPRSHQESTASRGTFASAGAAITEVDTRVSWAGSPFTTRNAERQIWREYNSAGCACERCGSQVGPGRGGPVFESKTCRGLVNLSVLRCVNVDFRRARGVVLAPSGRYESS